MDIIEFAEKLKYPLSPFQKTVLKLYYGLPLSGDYSRHDLTYVLGPEPDVRAVSEKELVRYLTKLKMVRAGPPNVVGASSGLPSYRELVLTTGRRSGKGHLAILITLYEIDRLIEGNPRVSPVLGPAPAAPLIAYFTGTRQSNSVLWINLLVETMRKADHFKGRATAMFMTREAQIDTAVGKIRVIGPPVTPSSFRGQYFYLGIIDDTSFLTEGQAHLIQDSGLAFGMRLVLGTPQERANAYLEPMMKLSGIQVGRLCIQSPTPLFRPSVQIQSYLPHLNTEYLKMLNWGGRMFLPPPLDFIPTLFAVSLEDRFGTEYAKLVLEQAKSPGSP